MSKINYEDVMQNKQKIVQGDRPQIAKVVEVSSQGVRIKIAKEEPRPTFYNSLEVVNVGDTVYFVRLSGSLLILGSLKYKVGV